MTALSHTMRPTSERAATALGWGYLAVVFLALASNGANAVLPLAVCLFLAGGLCIGALVLLGPPESTRMPFAAGIWLFLGFTVWIGVQTLPAPAGLVSPAWTYLAELGIEGASSISMAPAQGAVGWLWLALPFLMFLAGLLIFRTDEHAAAAFRRTASAAGVFAVVCLVQFLIAPGTLLFSEKRSFGDSYTFVFVNRNTAATCLGLVMLMLLVNVRQEWRSLDRTRLLAWIVNGVALPKSLRLAPFALQLGLLLAVIACLAMTKSRAGIGASAIAAAVSLALFSWHGGGNGASGFSRRRRSLRRKIGQAGVYVLAVLVAVSLFAPRAILRGEVHGADDARFCITEGLLAAAGDNWLTGGGFGAFPLIFNPYRDPVCGIQSIWDKAHDSYLEGFITLGILFIPLLLVGFWGLLRAYRTGLRERRNMIAYPVAGLGGLCLVALHSALDFSLQIPGMAAFYAVLAALTTTVSLGRPNRDTAKQEDAGIAPGKGRALAMTLGGLALLAVVVAASSARDTISVLHTRAFARALDADKPVDTATLHTLVADRLPAGRLKSCNGDILRASLTVLLAGLDRIDRDQAYDEWAAAIAQTEKQVLHALACMPGDSNLWLRLAMLRQAGGELPREQASLMKMAQQLSPSERRQLIGRLAHWNRLSPATLALAGDEAAADVRNGLNYLPVADIRMVLETPSSSMAGIIQEVLPLLSAERRAILEKRGFDWMSKRGKKEARFLPNADGATP